jgi:predicted PurR-regulated permease PerM
LEELARFSGRCLLVFGLVYVVGYVVRSLPFIFVSLFIALLFTSLLQPLADWLGRRRLPPSVAALATLLLAVAFVGGLLAFIIPRTVARISSHADMLAERAQQLAVSLTRLVPGQKPTLDELGLQAGRWVRQHAQELALGAASGLTTAVTVLAGMLLVLVLTFFFMKDGRGLVRSALSPLPPRRRQLALAAANRAWRTLSQWVRGTVLVALADAVGIGVGLLILGVPLALPLTLLTFLCAFVPILGALLAGSLAVLVAWATLGTQDALITLGIVLAVQQVEGNVLQPLVMGRVLPLHPAMVLLAVTAGGLLAGVAGAFVAVPLTAAVTAGTQAFLAEGRRLRPRERERPASPERPPAGPDRQWPAPH